jgi:formylmethanofuran dehydrogenase subunit E
MGHVEESTVVQQWICSKCEQVITDENEYIDNKGVCDDCFRIPLKRRLGLLK